MHGAAHDRTPPSHDRDRAAAAADATADATTAQRPSPPPPPPPLVVSSAPPSDMTHTACTHTSPPSPQQQQPLPQRQHADPTAALARDGDEDGTRDGAAMTHAHTTTTAAMCSAARATSDRALPPPQPPAHHTDTTAATTATTTTTTASGSGGAGDGDGAAALAAAVAAYTRPATALTAHVSTLYKLTKAMYCVRCRRDMPAPRYNNGYASKEGHYHVLLGEAIAQRYYVQEVLGRGSFGTVVRCYDDKRHLNVALKITRLGAGFRTQAKVELDILLKLNTNANLDQLVVKLLKAFDWQGHIVLVFELLSFNLYELIKCTRYNGVSLDLVRKFAYQLVHTLLQLELHQPPIIHCDLKPENIMLKNQNRSGIRLIDFGSACYASWLPHNYIQSRFYRSPEVILRLKYSTAIDRWSLACVLVELHTGVPLFDGTSEAAQLARFTAMLGPVPHELLSRSPVVHKFYLCNRSKTTYTLKDVDVGPVRSLASVLGVTTGGPRGGRRGTPGHEEAAYVAFHSFIAQLLCYDPEQRLSCRDALRHPFLAQLAATSTTATACTTPSPALATTAAAAAAPTSSSSAATGT